MAERGRFELPKGSSPSTVFKTVAFNHSAISPKIVEATPGFEPGMGALQAPALPLGYIADIYKNYKSFVFKNAVVRMAGIEPARTKSPRDFKSLVSTYSTTLALLHLKTSGAGDGGRTRGPDLGKVVLYH